MKLNKKRIVIRLLASPFVLGMILITYTYHAFKRWFHFLIFGGEYVDYAENEQANIQSIYLLLKKQQNEQV